MRKETYLILETFCQKDISLQEAMTGADIFIGLAAPNSLPEHYLDLMTGNIIFALSNPVPRSLPKR